MGKFLKQYGLLVWLSVILIVGFVTTNIVSYMASRDAIQDSISEQALPITGDNVYSEIQKDILHPIFVSSQMAGDTFLRDWLINGEDNPEQLQRYLQQIRHDQNAISTFVVSEHSHQYYHPDGILKSVSESDPRDQWYFRVRNLKTPYETNVDLDQANKDNITIFINYRILDYQGNFIGVTGIGLTLDTLKHLIDRYQEKFQRNIYFVNPKGEVTLSGNRFNPTQRNISQIPGIATVAAQILQNQSSNSLHLSYQKDTGKVLLNSRYIPELGWYLMVEQNLGANMESVQSVFLLNLGISAAVTAVVMAILLLSVRRFQGRLEKSAATDNLTGLLNRQAFDIVFEQAQLDSQRTHAPLCMVLLDIDHFKFVNDKYGHLVGDHILREVGMIAKRSLRESDVICRWGGEEFLILLKNCVLEKATSIAETLRFTIANNDFSRTTHLAQGHLNITVSMGVAQVKFEESEDSVFERADVALYQAKENGRNSVYFSE
jgi:diguanylate cyclase (GGDEF)-like protein